MRGKKYRIEADAGHRIRIRLCVSRLTEEQAEILRCVFSGSSGVKKVTVYRNTAGCALEYSCSREAILAKLDQFRFENVRMMAEKEEMRISAEEMKNRKLAPALKRKLRLRILAETAADIALPMPVQLLYHTWQLITLKDL